MDVGPPGESYKTWKMKLKQPKELVVIANPRDAGIAEYIKEGGFAATFGKVSSISLHIYSNSYGELA